MKNVKSVCQNPQKFVNYTKHSISDKSPKQQIKPRPESRPTKAFSKEVNEESIAAEEDDMFVEFIDESLDVSRADDNVEESVFLCRLCATSPTDLMPIFNEDGQFYEDTECLRLMPVGLIEKDDGLPQMVCLLCINKLQSCASIIEGFVLNQSLFTSE